jgi:A/G-specific adenine glycosylase
MRAKQHRSSLKRVRIFRKSLLAWFANYGRNFPWRRDEVLSEYEIVITESLLQRTRAETVARAIGPFLTEFSDWSALAKASLGRLQEHLKPIGLWRRRADSFLRLAAIVSTLDTLPRTRHGLEKLPGIGQYIASAILLMRDKKTEPLLDSNMARVLERFFGPRRLADIRYDPYLQALSRRVIRGPRSIVVNWAILDLAAMICLPRRPKCKHCPLSRDCLSAFRIR